MTPCHSYLADAVNAYSHITCNNAIAKQLTSGKYIEYSV